MEWRNKLAHWWTDVEPTGEALWVYELIADLMPLLEVESVRTLARSRKLLIETVLLDAVRDRSRQSGLDVAHRFTNEDSKVPAPNTPKGSRSSGCCMLDRCLFVLARSVRQTISSPEARLYKRQNDTSALSTKHVEQEHSRRLVSAVLGMPDLAAGRHLAPPTASYDASRDSVRRIYEYMTSKVVVEELLDTGRVSSNWADDTLGGILAIYCEWDKAADEEHQMATDTMPNPCNGKSAA